MQARQGTSQAPWTPPPQRAAHPSQLASFALVHSRTTQLGRDLGKSVPSPLSCPLHTEPELEPVFKASLCPTPFSFPIQSSSSILRTLAPPSHLLSWTLWLPPLPASLLLAMPHGPTLPIRTPLPLLCPPPSRSHLKHLCAPDRQSLLKTPFSERPPAQPGTASSQRILAGGCSDLDLWWN